MKRNTLTTAVLAGLTGMAGMVSVSNAVNVNPDGLGQVLLYPYYTARGGNDTLISIVNTTERGKAVKIRFIEALNSREVLDFNIYLSPFDVWTAGVTATEAGGAKMVTADTSCTVPYFVDDPMFTTGNGIGEVPFRDFQYNAAAVPSQGFEGTIDGGPSGIERTASGYIEVIEMGTFVEQPDAPGGDGTVAYWAKHDETGVPRDCHAIVDLWREAAPGANPQPGDLGYWKGVDTAGNPVNSDPNWGFDDEIGASGGLFGAGSIINVQEGTMFSYNATAIDGFWTVGTTRHTDPGDLFPNLASNNNQESIVFNNGALQGIDWDLEGSPLALNATLTLAELMNEYNIEAGLAARTEWVLTFPTKAFHTDAAPGGNSLVEPGDDAIPPFSNIWTVEEPRSCDTLSFRFWDREEQEPTVAPGEPGGVGISPPAPPSPAPEIPVFQLCRESNVIRFTNDGSEPDATEILAEPLREGDFQLLSYTNLDLPENFQNGWMRFDFSSRESLSGTPTIGTDNAVRGLPVIGFAVTTFRNGDLGSGVRANYGGTFQHRGSRQGFVSVDD